MDKCAIKKCRQPAGLTYYGKPVCDKHWEKYTAAELKKALKIKDKQ